MIYSLLIMIMLFFLFISLFPSIFFSSPNLMLLHGEIYAPIRNRKTKYVKILMYTLLELLKLLE
jgi:hypothetical protein